MHDQAKRLRELVNDRNRKEGPGEQTTSPRSHQPAPRGRHHGRIIAVTSGKGGVGKTTMLRG